MVHECSIIRWACSVATCVLLRIQLHADFICFSSWLSSAELMFHELPRNVRDMLMHLAFACGGVVAEEIGPIHRLFTVETALSRRYRFLNGNDFAVCHWGVAKW